MLGDHRIMVCIAQVTIENLCQNTGGTQILVDLRSIHRNCLLVIVRCKSQVGIYLGFCL